MGTISVSLDLVAPGYRCFDAIRDIEGRVLIGRGNRLTHSMLRGLADRGVNIVRVSARDLAAFSRRDGPEATGFSAPGNSFTGIPDGGPSLAARRMRRCCEPYSAERAERFSQQLREALWLVEEIGQRIDQLSKPALAELCRLPNKLSSMLVEDSDQTIAACTTDDDDVTLAKRTTQLSTLAMALGIELGLSDSDVMLLGHAGLLHDLSLFEMPHHFWDPSVPLTQRELVTYRSHPERTLHLLGDHPYVSRETRAIIVQLHELGDGTGFPNRLTSQRMHRLSRVLSCVEVYLALVSPGLGRKSIVPHDALGLMLHQTRCGAVDANILRALIQLVGLFPIGSVVQLENGQWATVVRRYEDQYHAPVVVPHENDADEILFIADSKFAISAPVPSPLQMRLERRQQARLHVTDLINRYGPPNSSQVTLPPVPLRASLQD